MSEAGNGKSRRRSAYLRGEEERGERKEEKRGERKRGLREIREKGNTIKALEEDIRLFERIDAGCGLSRQNMTAEN